MALNVFYGFDLIGKADESWKPKKSGIKPG